MKKKKILHVLHAVGGVDVWLRITLRNINDSIFENIIIHGVSDTKNKYTSNTNKTIKEYKLPLLRKISPINDLNCIIKTIKIIKSENIDIIHAHSAKGGAIARVSALFTGTKVLHTPHAYSYLSTPSSFKRAIYLFIEQILKHFHSILLACSQSEINRGLNDVGYKKKNVFLFNNSINSIKKLEPLSIPKTWPDKYICTVGRPSYQKRLDMMIRIFYEVKQQQKDIHLIIMGVGFYSPDLEKIKKQIKNLELEQAITLLDWTSHNNIYTIVNNAQFYISTARYEGLPYSIIEVLALKKAVIATEVDGNKDLVEDGKNGFLTNDETVFAEKINLLLSNDKLRKSFSKNSHELFLKKYNIKHNITLLENIYNQSIKL